MKRHSEAETRSVLLRFHTQGADGLCFPIPFLFVTERMCEEILAERELILGMAQAAALSRQRKLFARYDPRQSAAAFHAFLRLFAAGPDE
jgi:hypothetical protein